MSSPESVEALLAAAPRVGATLSSARVRAGRSRDEVAAEMGIPERYLVDLEAGRLDAFDQPLHAAAYVRLYARAVGLDEVVLDGDVGEGAHAPAARAAPSAQPTRPMQPAAASGPGLRPWLSWRVAVALVALGAVVTAAFVLSPAGNGVLDDAADNGGAGEAGESESAGEGAAEHDGEGPADEDETAVSSDQLVREDREDEGEDDTAVAGDTRERDDAASGDDADAAGPAPADARPPAEVEVQLLDASGDPARREAAQQWLQQQGYVIGFVDVAAATRAETVVFAEDDHPADAAALAAAAPVLAEVEPAEGLGADVDVHLLVGEDWPLDP